MISIHATLHACEKGLFQERALSILQEIPRMLLQPDVISCIAATNVTEKSLQLDAALGLLLEMPRRLM